MEVNKETLFFSFVGFSVSKYLIERREDIYSVYLMFIENQYIASLEEFLKLIVETIEYAVKIAL